MELCYKMNIEITVQGKYNYCTSPCILVCNHMMNYAEPEKKNS